MLKYLDAQEDLVTFLRWLLLILYCVGGVFMNKLENQKNLLCLDMLLAAL